MKRTIDSIVFAPRFMAGGVKSLYSVCGWLGALGRSRIAPMDEPKLASWFGHQCALYDDSYRPDVVVYPEIYQPRVPGQVYHICFALGKHGLIEPHADLTACKSLEIMDWVKRQHPAMPTALMLPSIERSVFEYDGRPKKNIISYMTRSHKHPETADLLRARHGDRVVEIVDCAEAVVAEMLKAAKVFVWRGDDKEGSPRPPKEALVAGCVVVGMADELHEKYHTNFGIRCRSVDELVHMAGQALWMPVPSREERAVVRDSAAEKEDWLALMQSLSAEQRAVRKFPS